MKSTEAVRQAQVADPQRTPRFALTRTSNGQAPEDVSLQFCCKKSRLNACDIPGIVIALQTWDATMKITAALLAGTVIPTLVLSVQPAHAESASGTWLLRAIVPLLFIANTINIGADLSAMADATKLLVGG
jgi:hypothetical protein